jgi:hypothetical protein
MHYKLPSLLSHWEIADEVAARRYWETTRTRLSWHECGHAVVARQVGAGVARIVLRINKLNGHFWPIRPTSLADSLTILAGGAAADRLYDPDVTRDHPLDLDDCIRMRKLVYEHGLGGQAVKLARQRAWQLVNEHWRSISRLARALERSGSGELDGAAVEGILSQVSS